MKTSASRILTTHVGSLPRPDDLMTLYRENAADAVLLPRLKAAVGEIVARQGELGIDVVNDGEYGIDPAFEELQLVVEFFGQRFAQPGTT